MLACAPPGCAATIAEAPFPVRSGSVVRGDLRGPYDGQVLDADNGKPLAGAAVLASWSYEGGMGLVGPAGAEWRRVETDADGRYRVPAITAAHAGRLARFTLVVYKRGHLAYRSDRRIEDASPRADFTQLSNVVRMPRLPSTITHAAHLRYVGAGGPLLAELGAELQQASEEQVGSPTEEAAAGEASASSAGEGAPDATQLLSPDELKAVTGYEGSFTIGKLGDVKSTSRYDSVHFHAVDQPEKFDAALRLFRLGGEAEKQYERYLTEFPSAEEKNEIGDRSLRSREGDLFAVVAVDRKRGALVVFTCGAEQCRDVDTMVGLLKRIWPRLDRALAARRAEAEPADKAVEPPAEEKPPERQGPLRLKRPELTP